MYGAKPAGGGDGPLNLLEEFTFRLQPIVEIVSVHASATFEDLIRPPRDVLVSPTLRARLQVRNKMFKFPRPVERRVTSGQVRGSDLADVFPVSINGYEPTDREGRNKMGHVEAVVSHPCSSKA